MDKKLPWTIKYRPRSLSEVLDQENAKNELLSWIKQWLSGKPIDKKAVLLYGPAGCGKTSLVEALAKDMGLELIEMNASDFRRREDIERIALVSSLQRSLLGKGKIILLDEIDGLSGMADKGGIEAILQLVEETKWPIIMTANNPWTHDLRPLRDLAKMVEVKRLKNTDVVVALKKICGLEKITCEDDALRIIADRSEGDLRSAINDLQAIGEAYGKVTVSLVEAMAAYRNREYAPFEALRNLFNSKYAWMARNALLQSNIDYEQMILWINEHIPTYFSDPEEVWRAYEALSRADVYRGRIVKTGNWDLLTYVMDMAGPGVALSRKITKFHWAKFTRPERLDLVFKARRARELRTAIAEVFSRRLLMSKRSFTTEVLPYLHIVFQNNPEYAAKISMAYGLTDEMINFLAGPRAKEVMSYIKKYFRRS